MPKFKDSIILPDGYEITAEADLGTGGGGGATEFSGCRVGRNTAQSMTPNTDTPVDWTSSDYDTDGFADIGGTNPERLTIPSGMSGYYLIVGTLYILDGIRGIQINGSTVADSGRTTSVSDAYGGVSTVEFLNEGDYVTLYGKNSSGSMGSSDDRYAHLTLTRIAGSQYEGFSGARATRESSQSIPTGADTGIEWDTSKFDTNTFLEIGGANPERITIPADGKYLVTASVEFSTNGTGFRQLEIKVNGTTRIAEANDAASSSFSTSLGATTVAEFSTSDYIEVIVTQNSGGNLNVGFDEKTFISIHKLNGSPPSTIVSLSDVNITGQTDGQVLTYDDATSKWINADPTGGSGGATEFSGAHIARSTAQSLTAGQYDPISWDTVDYDTDLYWDAGNPTRLTVPADGKYFVHFNVFTVVAATLTIRLNGGSYLAYKGAPPDHGGDERTEMTEVLDLSAGDYIELYIRRASTGNVGSDESYLHASIYKLSGSTYEGFNGVRTTKSSNQTITAVTHTAITFDGEDYDTNSYHDNATNNSRLTAPSDGYYHISGVLDEVSNASTAARYAYIWKGDVATTALAYDSWESVNGGATRRSISTTAFLSEGEYVTLGVYFGSNGGDIGAASTFDMFKVNGSPPSTIVSLSDVNISGATDGDILRYNGTSGKWENFSDDWHVVGDPGEPAFENSWSNFGANRDGRFRKLPDGTVVLSGLVGGGTAQTTIFTLPAGYRIKGSTDSSTAYYFPATSNHAFGSVQVNTDGTVVLFTGSTSWVDLSGVRFIAEQ
jgi:hypothetical protein